jgi:cephalosporin hydroxylase
MSDTVLIFPGGLPESQRIRDEARSSGHRVLGASALSYDPAASSYDAWEHLPYVHHVQFAERLTQVLLEHQISTIYSPHEVTSSVLAELLPKIAPNVRLVAPNPLLRTEEVYRKVLAKAQLATDSQWFGLTGGARRPAPLVRAGFIRLIDTIPGMTDLDKIDALFEVMRHAVEGDIVEIGSWWGRSAALFTLLSQYYSIGSVLCIDPWKSDRLDQGVKVLDDASARMDTEHAFNIFQMNLAPLSKGDLNYCRATSEAAAVEYGADFRVANEIFGETRYTGSISILHIDGNHSLKQVSTDARLWCPLVKPGGWIIFDDYVWAFGDGPMRVGDAYLEQNGHQIDLSFVMGTALFIKLAP